MEFLMGGSVGLGGVLGEFLVEFLAEFPVKFPAGEAKWEEWLEFLAFLEEIP